MKNASRPATGSHPGKSRSNDEERKWLGYPISEWVLALVLGVLGFAAMAWWGVGPGVVFVLVGLAVLYLIGLALIGLLHFLSALFGGRL